MKPEQSAHVQAIGRVVRILLVGALFAIGLAQSASADTIYTYTGNPFDTFYNSFTCPPICNVSGSFTLTQPLAPNMLFDPVAPTSYSFTDGVNIFNQTNSTIGFSIVQTDSSGMPIQWSFSFQQSPFNPLNGLILIRTTNNLGFQGDQTFIGQGHPAAAELFNSPGTWTVATVVPEPPSLLLLGTGLLCLGIMVLRR